MTIITTFILTDCILQLTDSSTIPTYESKKIVIRVVSI